MRLKESEEEWVAKMQMRKRDVPLGSRRWTPLPEEWFLNLDPWNPRRLRWRRWNRCVLEQERRQRCYRKDASERGDADIYNFGSKGRTEIWQIIYLESGDLFRRWQSWLELILEQNKLLRNWGACVDIVFWHVSRKVILVKGRWPIWKKPKDVQCWNRPMDQKNMLRRCWFVRSDARPMESCRWSQGRRRESGLYENLDDSVVVFKVVYL